MSFLAVWTKVCPSLGKNDFFYRCLFTHLTGLLSVDHQVLHALAFLAGGIPVVLEGGPARGERFADDFLDSIQDFWQFVFFNFTAEAGGEDLCPGTDLTGDVISGTGEELLVHQMDFKHAVGKSIDG